MKVVLLIKNVCVFNLICGYVGGKKQVGLIIKNKVKRSNNFEDIFELIIYFSKELPLLL